MSPSISRRLFTLAWPIIGLNVLNVLALAVDTAMIGRLGDSELALVGVGYGTQLIFLLMVGIMGLTVGTVAFVARAHGARDDDRVNHIVSQSTQLTVGVGLVVAVLGNLAAAPLLRLLGADDAAMDPAMDYLRPMLTGSAIAYLNLLYAAVLRGVGNTRLAFGVALASNALNALLNYGLILGGYGLPALGVAGAAVGTVLSQAFAVGFMVLRLRRGAVPGLQAPLRVSRLDWPLARDLLRIGWPASLDMLVLNAGFLTIIGLLARIDQAAVAAHGLGMRVQALAFVPGMSVSQATGAMVGQALGANNPDEARKILRSSVVLCVLIMSSLAGLIFLFAADLVQIFDVDPAGALGRYAILWMQLLGACMPFVGAYISLVGLFQGAGATRTSLAINLRATLAFQIPMSALLGFGLDLGAFGVWLAFPLSFAVKGALGWRAYQKGDWAQVGKRV